MMKYDSFNDIIQDLIDGKQADDTLLTVEDINEDLFKDFKDQRADFWKYLLEYMKSNSPINQNQLLENDNPNKSSLFGYINQKADLDYLTEVELENVEENIKKFWNKLMEMYNDGAQLDKDSATGKVEGNLDYYWNESLSRAISLFLLSFNIDRMKEKELAEIRSKLEQAGYDETEINRAIEKYKLGEYDFEDLKKRLKDKGIEFTLDNGIKMGNKGITHFHISDIINADAGLDFDGPPWVRPQYNVDGELYKEVRGADKIQSVLNSTKELQYTVSQHKDDQHWIRLLMPKYLRYVEVEDLNRNFWVIGQTIAALSAFLFGDESPLNELLRDMLNEIAQLWQNIMYLWATAALLMQKNYISKVHTEVVYLPNSASESYIKFDNFGNSLPIDASFSIEWDLIKERVEYLIEQYTACNVVIIPCIRNSNYKHNYYSEEIYPGMLLYNRNTNKLDICEFRQNDDNDLIRINVNKFRNRIYGLRELEDVYEYYYPYSADIVTEKSERFYGLLRTEISALPSLSANGWLFESFYINIYDRTYEVLQHSFTYRVIEEGEEEIYGEAEPLHGNGKVGQYMFGSFTYPYGSYPPKIKLEYKTNEANESDYFTKKKLTPITQGFYQGELISQWNLIVATKYTIENGALPMIPVLHFQQSAWSSYGPYISFRNNIEKHNANNVDARIATFFSNFAPFIAMQYIYNIEKGYYEDEDGNITNRKYFEPDMREYLKSIDVDCSNEAVSNKAQSLLNDFDFDKYISIFVANNAKMNDESSIRTNYKKEYENLDNNTKLAISSILLCFLAPYDMPIDLPPLGKKYENIPYVTGAKIYAADYDKKVLEIYGHRYIKETYNPSLDLQRFYLIETSRSQGLQNNLGLSRQAVIMVDKNGEVVNKTLEEENTTKSVANIDAGAGEGDKQTTPESEYYANSFLLYGQYPNGDQRYTGLMAYPDDKLTSLIYEEHFDYYRAKYYGAEGLYDLSLSYQIQSDGSGGKFSEIGGQNVYTIEQDLIMTKNGEEMTKDNWCAVTVKCQYLAGSKFYWGDNTNESDRTYVERYLLNGKSCDIVTTEETIEPNTNYPTRIQNQQKAICNIYSAEDSELDWMGTLYEENYFIKTQLAVQNIVSVFTHDGKYAQRVYVRQCIREENDYLKWIKVYDSKESKATDSDVDELRKEYKVISNNKQGYNYEKYKSNGQYLPGKFGDPHFPQDDDTSKYDIEAVGGILDTPYDKDE